MSAPRVASVIDLSLPVDQQKAVVATTPLNRPLQFTKEQVADPAMLTKQLQALHQEVAQTTQAVRSHPEQAPITFNNVVCGIGGTKVVLQHGFGAFADYVVTRWSGDGTNALYSLTSDERDLPVTDRLTNKNTLALRSFVAGTANIRVFKGG